MAGTIGMTSAILVGGWRRCLNGVRPRWPEQWVPLTCWDDLLTAVSMESGLDGRNNTIGDFEPGRIFEGVSMESGLDGRNNPSNGAWHRPPSPSSQWSPA